MVAQTQGSAETLDGQPYNNTYCWIITAHRNHILDTGNHPQLAATIGTGFDIDCKDALQSLHPAHRGGWLVVVHFAAGAVRYYPGAVFAVWRKEAVEACEIQSGARHQGRKSRHKIQRFQYDMSRAVTEGTLVLVDDPASTIQ